MPKHCKERVNPTCKVSTLAAILFIESLLLNLILPIFPQYMWDIRVEGFSTYNCTNTWREKSKQEIFQSVGIFSSLVFLSGYLMQLILLPIIRRITGTNIVLSTVMLFGSILVVTGLLSLVFFKEQNLYKFVLSRVLQCAGASLVIGLGLVRLSRTISIDEERQTAFSVATLGMSVGVIIGPVLGGVLYYIKDSIIFQIILCSPVVFEILLHGLIFDCESGAYQSPVKDRWSLLLHREVFIGLLTICISTACVVVVNTMVPLWLLHIFNIRSWMVGLIFLPGAVASTLGSFLSTCIFGMRGQCACIVFGLIAILCSMVLIPFIYTFKFILIPMAFIGLGQGISSSLVVQMLAKYLTNVEKESESTFFLFIEIAEKFGSVIGPGICVPLLYVLKFEYVMAIFAGLIALVIPLQLCLSDCCQTSRDESQKLIPSSDQSNSYLERSAK